MGIKFFFYAFMASLCLINSFFCNASLVDPDKVLIFNESDEIFDRITETQKRYFTACTAESADEVEFNQAKSFTKNSLFVRDIVIPMEHDIPLVECEHPYKPSMLFQETVEWFELGYEVYIDSTKPETNGLHYASKDRYLLTSQIKALYAKRKLKNKLGRILSIGNSFKRSKLQNDVKNANDSEGKIDSIKSSKSENDAGSVTINGIRDSDDVKKESESITKNDLEKILGLLWIEVFHFNFNVDQCGPTKIVYSAEKGELNKEYKCQEYSTDEALYENIDFQSIYKPANQVKLFKKLPVFHTPPTTGLCGHKYGCLKPHQMIPHYYYHSQASKIATCSAVNTLPVWETISDGILTKIDRYLYAVSQIWGPSISIITGITDVLSYSTGSRFSFSPKKLFMDWENKKIPIPRIIYKILKFAKKGDEFVVIFVIHNDPVLKEINHICPLAPGDWWHENLRKSWKFLENQVTESGLSYPCPMRQEVLDRLKIHRNRSNDVYYRTLSLDDFSPIGLTENKTIEVIPQTTDEKPQPIEEKTETMEDGKKPVVKENQSIEKIRQLIEKKVVELFGEN